MLRRPGRLGSAKDSISYAIGLKMAIFYAKQGIRRGNQLNKILLRWKSCGLFKNAEEWIKINLCIRSFVAFGYNYNFYIVVKGQELVFEGNSQNVFNRLIILIYRLIR